MLVLCNLPPRKMRGIPSAGMLLCASNSDHTVVEPLTPPEEAQPGERIHFGEELASPTEPATTNQVAAVYSIQKGRGRLPLLLCLTVLSSEMMLESNQTARLELLKGSVTRQALESCFAGEKSSQRLGFCLLVLLHTALLLRDGGCSS